MKNAQRRFYDLTALTISVIIGLRVHWAVGLLMVFVYLIGKYSVVADENEDQRARSDW